MMSSDSGNSKIIVAFDTNGIRSKHLIPFLSENKDRFQVVVPAVVFAERLYAFLLVGASRESYNDELASYDGKFMALTRSHVDSAIKMAHACRKSLPFRHHARDYFIAGQCSGTVDILITYNKKHFEPMKVERTKILTPEEFFSACITDGDVKE